MPSKNPPIERLAFYLLSQEVGEFADCLDEETKEKLVLAKEGNHAGVAYQYWYGQAAGKVPPWVPLFETFTESRPQVRSRTARAVVLIRLVPEGEDPRFLALTAGIGSQFLVNPRYIVDEFGLKVALNALSPHRIRSADSKTLDDAAMIDRRQASRDIAFDEFGFDASRALLKAVTGEPKDKYRDFAVRITGSAAAILHRRTDGRDLGQIAMETYRMYRAKDYKIDFSWLDSLRTADRTLVPALDAALVDQLNSTAPPVQLAPPDILDYTEVVGFYYPKQDVNGPHEVDMDWQVFSQKAAALFPLELADLVKEKIKVRSAADGKVRYKWNVYKCLIAQVKLEGQTFILTDGKWFRVEKKFLKRIDDEIQGVKKSSQALPPAGAHEKEPQYNERLKADMPSGLVLDRKLVKHPLMTSGIELCDVLCESNEFIHVKQRNFSSTMSHLFAQGRVSAETIVGSAEFRGAALEKIREIDPVWHSKLDWESLHGPDVTVTYALIADKGYSFPDDLPFFSKVSYSHAVSGLKALRCQVRYAVIEREST